MMTHKGTVILDTLRLHLRRFTLDDAQTVYDCYTSDEKVSECHNLDAHVSVEETKTMLAEWVAKYRDLNYYHWLIEFNCNVVGEINFFNIADEQERCELGYTIGSKWWNHGLATEAATKVIRFAFDEVGFNKVIARYDTENAASGRVMQKNGMTQEGLFREHNIRKDGTRSDIAFYAILKSTWNRSIEIAEMCDFGRLIS